MELNNDHISVLKELDDKFQLFISDSRVGPRIMAVFFAGKEKVIAHLLERGLIQGRRKTASRLLAYEITATGIRELALTRGASTDDENLKAHIARLESELAAARARLAGPVGELRGVNGALSDGLHDGG
jgi:hypothetical protein